MHKQKISVLIFLFTACLIHAKNIAYNLDASLNEVSTNEMFQVTLEIFNAGNASVTLLEENPAVTLRESGKSSSFSFTNGQQSSSVTITYIAKATKEGKQKIGPFRIKNRSESVDTSPIFVNVSASSKKQSMNLQETEEAFIKAVVSKTSVYEGEFIDISVLFYTSVETKINDYTQLEFPSNAWTEDIRSENEHKRRIQMGNRLYDEYEIEHKRLFINTAGEYKILPAKINLYLFSRSAMFSFYSTPVFLETEEINLTVKPLPKSPIDLEGTVPTGTFTSDVKLSAQEVKVGEPITMTVALNGSGNFHVINKYPISHGKEIEVFTSKSNLIKNGNTAIGKSWETILIPKKQGEYTISVQPFIYFDTEAYEYKTLDEKSFIIKVSDNETENSSMQTIDFDSSKNTGKQSKKVDPKSLFMISNVLEKHPVSNSNIYLIIIMAAMYVLAVAFFAVYLFFKFISEKGNKSVHPLKRLEREVSKIDTSNLAKAIEKLYAELEIFIINEFEIDSVNIRKNTLKEKLSSKLPEELIKKLIDIISEFEIIRFGGMDASVSGINELKSQVLNLCRELAKYKD